MPYTFALHILSRETWAAQLDDAGRVVGIAGPLLPDEVSDSRLPDYLYRRDEPAVSDFNQRHEDFRWGLVSDAAEPN
jgi:hypothetical protein